MVSFILDIDLSFMKICGVATNFHLMLQGLTSISNCCDVGEVGQSEEWAGTPHLHILYSISISLSLPFKVI